MTQTSNKALSAVELASKLQQQLPGWNVKDSKLCKEFKFENFSSAFAFMTEVAFFAEKSDHHPEWTNVYNRVSFNLITHDCNVEGGAVTERDIALASYIENLNIKNHK